MVSAPIKIVINRTMIKRRSVKARAASASDCKNVSAERARSYNQTLSNRHRVGITLGGGIPMALTDA